MQDEEIGMRRLLFITAVLVLISATASPSRAQLGETHAMASMQQRSADLARSYLQTWSSNARAALDQVPQLYAPRVRFYGRVLDRDRLMREKAAFLRRWPIRRYAHRPGTMQVSCDALSTMSGPVRDRLARRKPRSPCGLAGSIPV